MCFSATASFVGSGVLAAGGILAITRFKFTRKEIALAAIPIIFGIHQFSEGIVWLGVNGVVDPVVQTAAMYFFAFIAICFWPIFIPLSVAIYEYPRRKIPFAILLFIGAALSCYLFWSITVYSSLTLNIECCNSLAYIYHIPWGLGYIDAVYVSLVVVPFLLSPNPRIRYILGPGFLITFLIALALQKDSDYPSIWCFLAAMLSIANYFALLHPKSRELQRLSR